MSTTGNTGKFKKYNTPEGRTLWQIFWTDSGDGGEEEPHLTIVDTSASRQDATEDQEEDVIFTQKTINPLPSQGTSLHPDQNQLYKDFSEREWEAIDMRSNDGEFTGHNMLERKDSDLDLFFPGSKRKTCMAQMRWCFVNCKNPVFWRQYWWIPAVILIAVVIYVVITVTIVQHM